MWIIISFLLVMQVVSWYLAYNMQEDLEVCVNTNKENYKTYEEQIGKFSEYHPGIQDTCWFKISNGDANRVKKVRVMNYTLYDKAECEYMQELCRLSPPCWWDNSSSSCNCDIQTLINSSEAWEVNYGKDLGETK